ncbi:MAG: hypothetical protein ABW019_17780 [Chitinophagaceae bacterium]
MRLLLLLLIAGLCLSRCTNQQQGTAIPMPATMPARSYTDLKAAIDSDREAFGQLYRSAARREKLWIQVKDYWVRMLGRDLYEQWNGTPWDFNGTTRVPHEGTIACGYFVTGLLLDMGYPLDRVKLSTCASLTMMKALTRGQRVLNASYLSYAGFCATIRDAGKGIFIVGLDYHTGFLVNDGTDTWFLHSNYINRAGVVKEKMAVSAALRASRTRFVVSLTSDTAFLLRWMKN